MSERRPIAPDLVKEFVLAAHGKPDRVRALYDGDPGLLRASMDWGEGDWECGLEAAGHIGNQEIAEFLLAKGAPMTVFSAAMLGRAELVKAFVDADPETSRRPGVHGISLMYHVALSGKVEIAELLLTESPGCDEALHAGVRFGHAEMVAWLLEYATDVNVVNFQGLTPLSAAIERNESKIAELLRAKGGREAPVT